MSPFHLPQGPASAVGNRFLSGSGRLWLMAPVGRQPESVSVLPPLGRVGARAASRFLSPQDGHLRHKRKSLRNPAMKSVRQSMPARRGVLAKAAVGRRGSRKGFSGNRLWGAAAALRIGRGICSRWGRCGSRRALAMQTPLPNPTVERTPNKPRYSASIRLAWRRSPPR